MPNIPLDKIEGVKVGVIRKVATAQWESLQFDCTLEVKEGVPLEVVMAHVEDKIESAIANAAQVREARVAFYSAMLRFLRVPVTDIADALKVLGWPEPVSVLDYEAITEPGGAIETLLTNAREYGPRALPLEWVWWKDGKHPHPLKNVTPIMSDEGQVDEEDGVADESATPSDQ